MNFKLTGVATATFDSIVLHWVTDNRDPTRVAYDEDLLGLVGVSRAQLPAGACDDERSAVNCNRDVA